MSTRVSEKQKEVMPLPSRHPDLERALERLVDGGTAGRWEVIAEDEVVVIHRRGADDGFATGNRIAKEIDDVLDALAGWEEDERE